MTRSLAIFGDSLMDAGNLDQVANIVGQDPFQESIYNRGGNVRPPMVPCSANTSPSSWGRRWAHANWQT